MTPQDKKDGFLGGKYESAEALEEAYKSQDREVQRLQEELSQQRKTVEGLQPVAEILNRPGGFDAVEAYLTRGAPQEPEVDIYEGLPTDVSEMTQDQLKVLMSRQEEQLKNKFAKQTQSMVNEAITAEQAKGKATESERLFRERHGIADEESFSSFKQYANGISTTDLQDALYSQYLASLGGQPTQAPPSQPRPNLPQGAGMGAGVPAASLSDEQAFIEKRRSQFFGSRNEVLEALKAPIRRS